MELYFMIEVVAQDGVFEFPPLPPPLFSQGFIDGLGGWCFLGAVGVPFLGGLLGWHGQRCVVFGWLMIVAAYLFWDAFSPAAMIVWHGRDAATTYDQPGTVAAFVLGPIFAGVFYLPGKWARRLIRWIARKPAEGDTVPVARFPVLKWLATIAVPPAIVVGALLGISLVGADWRKLPDHYAMEEDAVNALEVIRTRNGRLPADLDELERTAFKLATAGILESAGDLDGWLYALGAYHLEDDGRYRLELRGSPRRILGEPGRVVIEPR